MGQLLFLFAGLFSLSAPAGVVGQTTASSESGSSVDADEQALSAQRDELETLLDERAERGPAFQYSADSSYVQDVQGDSIVLRGNAAVDHKGARLEAGEMVYHRAEELVDARALLDSSGLPLGMPTLRRGNDVIRGERILYDLGTGEGVILDGKIQYKDGFYSGRYIETKSDEEFHVHQGSYTTCDSPHPHFDFYSPRIKVLVGDMAIARPVYFRIGEKRLVPIPFYVFSLREDRQSGILTPGFGRRPISFASRESEWEVRNLGYYFAPNDYWDVTLSAHMRQRSGWLAGVATAYAWRYRFRGRLETRVQNRQSGSTSRWEWWTNFSHSQEIGREASLRASGTFQSSKDFSRDNSLTLQERLNRTLRSNGRFSKRWRQQGASLALSGSYTKNLDTERFDLVLPEVSLRSNRKALFRGESGRRPSSRWYSRIYYDFNARLRNRQRGSPADTTTRTSADITVRLTSQQRPFSWLSVNSSFKESWRDRDLRSSQGGFEGIRTDRFGSSASLSQTLYGMFHPDIWNLTALRHVLKPDVGVRYQATRTDTGGAGFGGRPSSWKQSRQLTFRLSNTIWVKLLRDEDEEKVRLAQVNLSTAYDFDRDRRQLSDLVSSLTIGAGRRLNTRLSLRSEFYGNDDEFHPRPRLRQFEINSTLRFVPGRRTVGDGRDSKLDLYRRAAGESPDRSSRQAALQQGTVPGRPPGYDARGGEFGYEGGLQRDIDRRDRQSRFQISHYFSRRRGSSSRSWLRTALGGTWRSHWHIHYSLNYTLLKKGTQLFDADRVSAELLSIQRRFHDWTATVNIEPSRFNRDRAFYFKAQLVDIPQIRFERGDRRRR